MCDVSDVVNRTQERPEWVEELGLIGAAVVIVLIPAGG